MTDDVDETSVPVRMPRSLWTRFGEHAGDRGRSDIIRKLIAWYIREPGAKLPQRLPEEY